SGIVLDRADGLFLSSNVMHRIFINADELDQFLVSRMRCFTVTVHGFVYAFGSSTVISISRLPKFGRRNRSVTLAASVNGLPMISSQPSSMRPLVSTTSVSPSHFPTEYPYHLGSASGPGKLLPSRKI